MSRDLIIKTIRLNKPPAYPIREPEIKKTPPEEKDLADIFKKSLGKVGAVVAELNGTKELGLYLSDNYKNAQVFDNPETIAEYSADCALGKLNLIDTAVLTGQFGVAENGAIWLDETNFPNRIIPFIAQKVAIVLEKKNLVLNQQDAYKKVNMTGLGFGIFISGPSKTADIEQSLVYGAHGPKELFVIIY